jgi:hypothetical protein
MVFGSKCKKLYKFGSFKNIFGIFETPHDSNGILYQCSHVCRYCTDVSLGRLVRENQRSWWFVDMMNEGEKGGFLFCKFDFYKVINPVKTGRRNIYR